MEEQRGWIQNPDPDRSIGSSKKEGPFDRFNFFGLWSRFFLHGCQLGGIPFRESVALWNCGSVNPYFAPKSSSIQEMFYLERTFCPTTPVSPRRFCFHVKFCFYAFGQVRGPRTPHHDTSILTFHALILDNAKGLTSLSRGRLGLESGKGFRMKKYCRP
jgi:hypothetical protein